MSESTTYLTVQQAAEHVGAPSANALRKWVHRHSVPYFLYGKRMRFLRRDLDEAVGNTRKGQRALVANPSRFQQTQRPDHGALVSGQPLSDSHGGSVREALTPEQFNSVVGAR